MAREYVYMVRTREFVRLRENVYKIGRTRTENFHKRFLQYPKGSEIICFSTVLDSMKTERDLKKIFTQKFVQRLDYGLKYFEGDEAAMIHEFFRVALE